MPDMSLISRREFLKSPAGALWPGVPKDAFALMGYASSRCYIVPSLDLVAVHVGFRTPQWPEDSLLAPVVDSIIKLGRG